VGLKKYALLKYIVRMDLLNILLPHRIVFYYKVPILFMTVGAVTPAVFSSLAVINLRAFIEIIPQVRQ